MKLNAAAFGGDGIWWRSGQTGAGKTFTMHGPSMTDPANSEQRGLIPRTLEYLFAQIAREQRKSVRFSIGCYYRVAGDGANPPSVLSPFCCMRRMTRFNTSAAARTWKSTTRSSTTCSTLLATFAVRTMPH